MANIVKAVGVIAENVNGEILVLLRNKKSLEGNTYGLIGGNIDQGETEEKACIRETNEEIGIDIKPSELKFLKSYQWNRPDININLSVFKLAKDLSDSKIQLQPDEIDGYLWAKPGDLYKRADLMLGLYDILRDFYTVN